MRYYINQSNVRDGADCNKLAQFEADNVRGMEIEATDKQDAIKQFNRYVEQAQPKWRATAGGVDWSMKLLVVLVENYDNGMAHPVKWVVKENKQ